MARLPKKRIIMSNSQKIEFKGSTLSIYTKEENGFFFLQIFSGRSTTPLVYTKYKYFKRMEDNILRYVNSNLESIAQKKYQKEKRKKTIQKLKENLQPGTLVRTSFSYNMTFNDFYKVISKKGNTYKLEILSKEWVSGNIGYTGRVKAGNPTGDYIEGKITATGFKIDDRYASIINPNESFYENRMD